MLKVKVLFYFTYAVSRMHIILSLIITVSSVMSILRIIYWNEKAFVEVKCV
jgi:hypothetical protein